MNEIVRVAIFISNVLVLTALFVICFLQVTVGNRKDWKAYCTLIAIFILGVLKWLH